MSDDAEGDRIAAEIFDQFKADHPEYADRSTLDHSDAGVMIAFAHWNDRLQAAIDDIVPGLPQGEDRSAVSRAVIEELEQLRAELAEQPTDGILGKT